MDINAHSIWSKSFVAHKLAALCLQALMKWKASCSWRRLQKQFHPSPQRVTSHDKWLKVKSIKLFQSPKDRKVPDKKDGKNDWGAQLPLTREETITYHMINIYKSIRDVKQKQYYRRGLTECLEICIVPGLSADPGDLQVALSRRQIT